ncbi:M56 family metallopeptidase [Streptomyces sp. NPDC059679]|uniref:M56 family metallopeptidase n=1 Tax=Streptomyces sp. NPDC059679 TaxID=3346903 RepID=UPI0036ADDB39
MIVALALLGYAAALATAGGRLLRPGGWTDRAPRLGITIWLAQGVSALASAVMAGVALTVPTGRVSGNLAALLQSCVMALRAQYTSPGGAAAAASGAVLALAVLVRAAYCLAAALLRAARERARHHEVLDLVADEDGKRGLALLDHDEAAVYCLPGRRRRTVITAGALRALGHAQPAAVLAHERAHLAERHHLVLTWSAAMARAFPRIPLFRDGRAEVARLVELCADDAAAARTDRLTVAEALLAVASGRGRTPYRPWPSQRAAAPPPSGCAA